MDGTMHTDHPKSNPAAKAWFRTSFGVALPTLLWSIGCGGDRPGGVLASEARADTRSGSSNLQVMLGGTWKAVCCDGSKLVVADHDCWWTVYDRTLTDATAGLKVDCPEGGPSACECNGSGERMHGIDGGLNSSIDSPDGGPMYSDYERKTCVVVDGDGELVTAWTSSNCPDFRLR